RRGGEQRFQPLLALDLVERGQVLSVELDQVEREVVQRVRVLLAAVPALEYRLQRGEAWVTVLAIRHRLAIDQARRQVERGEGIGQRAELVGPIEALAGVDADLAARRADQHA